MLTASPTPEDAPPTAPVTAPAPEPPAADALFTSSARGAHLARQFTVLTLADWGFKPASDTSTTVALLVAELAANAVRHGHAPGHDRFHLALTHDAPSRTLRIELSDANPRHPPSEPPHPSPDDESGRGLLLVDVLATRWGTSRREPLGKTIWADVTTTCP